MGETDQKTLSAILDALNNGEAGAEEQLFTVVYNELRRMAHGKMIRQAPGNTLQTTALVHEAYLRLMGNDQAHWHNRRYFFGAAANSMRRILVDRARRRAADKRGAGAKKVPFEDDIAHDEPTIDFIALDEALNALSAVMPRRADVVRYRYFLGMTVDETAELLQVSARTVNSDWELAKSWLRREMTRGLPAPDESNTDGK
jgi:RNA polymerase sigma factor (TIGR02999 family)